MTCEIARELIQLAVDDQLSEELRASVNTHIADCPDCAGLMAETLHQTLDLQAMHRRESPSTWFANRLLDRLIGDVQMPEPGDGEGADRQLSLGLG